MRFSIIVPVYNAAPFLSACIDSVLAQSVSDWELILVNDGSTDDSERILQAYAVADKRIRILHQENRGQFFARQSGIEQARGEYVLFLDSDDTWALNCLDVLESELRRKPWDILLYTGEIYIHAVRTGRQLGNLGSKPRELTVPWLRQRLLYSHDLNSLCLKAFRRELFSGDEGDYHSLAGRCCGEDKVRLLLPVTRAETVGYIPNCLYLYNHRSGSAMHSYSPDNTRRLLAPEMFSFLYKYSKVWGMTDRKSQELLAAHYLRNYLSAYFAVRKHCRYTKHEKKAFREFPWSSYICKKVLAPSTIFRLSIREQIKLVAALLHL